MIGSAVAPIAELDDEGRHAERPREPCPGDQVASVADGERNRDQRAGPVAKQQIRRRRPSGAPLPDRFQARIDHRRAKQQSPREQANHDGRQSARRASGIQRHRDQIGEGQRKEQRRKHCLA